MCSSAGDIAFTPESSQIVSSCTHETTLLGGCMASSSSCYTETDDSSSKVSESGSRIALCGSRGMSRATHTCAFCSNETPAIFDNGDGRRKSFSRFEREKAENNDGNIIAAHWRCPWRERTDAANHQCPATAGELLFTSPVVLWLLSPFLYLNELTKLRLVSKKINCRWLSPGVIRWMMSNSIAMVFPAQWEPLPQPHPSPQETRYSNEKVLQTYSTSSGETPQQPQPEEEEEAQQRKSCAEGEQQQVREPEEENGQQHQQHQRQLHQREVQQMHEDQQKITGQENRQQHEQGKQQYTWRCADDVRYHSQELQAEQQQSPRPYWTETQRRCGHLSADSRLTAVSVSTSSCSPDAGCGLLAGVAAGGSEMSVPPAGGAADVTAPLNDSIRSSGNSALFSASPEGVARSLAASVSETATPTGESAYKREESSSAVRGVRRRWNGGEAAEASSASGEADIEKARLGRSAGRCKPLHRFNFLRSLLLRHPAAYGCPPLQLRQLTLHMPESPDAVLSLQQFQTFKTLLEVCSPTLEELHLYDFCCFYAVVDVSPAFSGVAVAGHSGSAGVAGDPPLAARGDLRKALKTVELAYISVFDPSGRVNALAVAEDDEVDAAGDGAVGQSADTAPAGDSVSAARQQLDASSSTQTWKLTLSFKMWTPCRQAMEEDPVDEDERQAWGPVDPREGGDSETSSSIGDADNPGSCFWTVNSYAAPVPSAISVSLPVAGSNATYEPPTLSSDLATMVESGANCFSLGCSVGTGTVSASSLRLTDPQGETSKCNAAMALTTEASSAAEGAPDERPIDSADDSAAAAAKDVTYSRQRGATGRGKSIENNALPEVPQTSSGSPGEVYSSASRLSDYASFSSFRESASSTAVTTCATAVKHRKGFHKEGQSSSRGVQSEFSRIPTGPDIYHFLHETVSNLQLRCCFPQLRYLQIYGSSDWKTARPYYSCLACLLLPRDRDIQMHNDGQSPRSGNEDSGANNEDGRNSSRSSQRSTRESEDSRNSSEACSSRRSAQDQDRDTHRIACRRRSSSQQSRNGNSTSQSGSCRGRRRSSSTPERGHCEQSSSACRMDSPRETQRRYRVFQKDHVGTLLSEVMSGAIADRLTASDDVKSRRAETAATAKGEGEKVKARHEDLAFPALEELYWQDASCVGEDMLSFLLASKSERLRKLSFSTYDPSTIACLLKECIAHPRFFKGLRQLDIDGLNFIWPEDEWWWFSGNSWFRFVEIWRLYTMGHNRLAPTYPVPHTLQQLQAQRRQRQKQRCLQRSRSACKATCVKVKAEQLRQPEDQQHHRRHRHAAPKGKEAARWKEREGDITETSATAFQGVEKETEKEELAQGKGTLHSGGRCDDESRNHTTEVTYGRGQHYTAGRTSAHAELVWHGESEPHWCEGKTVIAPQEVSSDWETTRLGGYRETHSSGVGSHSRDRAATQRERRRRRWRWIDDWACSSDEEEESQSNEAQALPAGFHGASAEVDIEGIQRALHRLPRVRKLRLLNFVGDTLREPGDSTHILGSFFPEADIEVQGSVFVGRRVLQRLLVKALNRDTRAAECRKKREWRSIGGATDRDTSRRGRASGDFDVARRGGLKGVRQRRAERQSRESSVRSQFSSEVDEERYSSDDSACSRLMEFPASPLWASTSQKINSSRSASLMLEGPATISRVDGSREWRRFNRGALQVSPLGEQYVSRWLRQGLVYKILMKLAVDWSGRADLRADGFHRECVAVYAAKILEGLPHWMRKKGVNTKQYRSLRILELSDCFHKSDKGPEGYIDKHGYFAPFGRAKQVLEYFTPFLLGLDCFSEEVLLPSNTMDDGDDDDDAAGRSVSVGARDENPHEEAQASDSLEDEDEWVSPGNGNEDVADAEAPQRLDEESGRNSSRAAEGEYTKLLVRRRTIHLDHDLAKSVHLAGTNDQDLGAATQRHSLIEKQSDMHDWAAGGACRGRTDRDTRPECRARELESVSSVLRSAAHEATAETGIVEGEAREATEGTSSGGESLGDCEGVLGAEKEITVGLRSTEEGVTASVAAGGSHGGRKHTVINDISERHGGFPDSPRQILRLEGVVGLAMPMYRRFSDFRKQSDLVMTVARAYKAQTRVLLVTDSTLLFYRRCKEFYDNALAALARDFKTVTEECKESLQIIDYRVYRPYAWRCELGDSQDHTCMPSFIRIFLRNNPEFHLARRLDAVRPVDNELAIGLEKVKTTLTAYVWIKVFKSS